MTDKGGGASNPETNNSAEGSTPTGGGDSEQQKIEEMLLEVNNDKTTQSVIKEPALLDPNTIIDEDRIVGRDKQISAIVKNLQKALNGERPEHMLLYGPTGTGKSLCTGAVAQKVEDICSSRGIKFCSLEINAQLVDSFDSALYKLTDEVTDKVGSKTGVPEEGVSSKRKRDRLFDVIEDHFDIVLFILDEIELLEGKYSNEEPAYSKLIYNLTRVQQHEELDVKVSVAALTNDSTFTEDLDSRALSTFNPEDVLFGDYNPDELKAILRNRKEAFREGALEQGVIPLAAAFGGQNHGDARKAIDTLRRAGEAADEASDDTVREEHVREVQDSVDIDRSMNLIETLTRQKQYALYAAASIDRFHDSKWVPGPAAYELYCEITSMTSSNQLKSQTIRRYLNEMETYNFAKGEKTSRGKASGVHKRYQFELSTKSLLADLERMNQDSLGKIDLDEIEKMVFSKMNDFYNS